MVFKTNEKEIIRLVVGLLDMTLNQTVEVQCPICANERRTKFFATRDYKQSINNDIFGVSRCKNCVAGYLSPRQSKAELGRYYDEHFYWSYENNESAKVSIEQLLALRRPQLEAKAAWLAHLTPGRLLDNGAKKGNFIHHKQGLGWQAEGVEFSNRPPNLFNMSIH